jgi:hypothetical protein
VRHSKAKFGAPKGQVATKIAERTAAGLRMARVACMAEPKRQRRFQVEFAGVALQSVDSFAHIKQPDQAENGQQPRGRTRVQRRRTERIAEGFDHGSAGTDQGGSYHQLPDQFLPGLNNVDDADNDQQGHGPPHPCTGCMISSHFREAAKPVEMVMPPGIEMKRRRYFLPPG